MWTQRLCPILLLCLLSQAVLADDLNDGIVADEAINDDLVLDKNINFIKRKAIARSLRDDDDPGCGGFGNQVFGPGTDLRNAIIVNLSNNEDSSATCSQR